VFFDTDISGGLSNDCSTQFCVRPHNQTMQLLCKFLPKHHSLHRVVILFGEIKSGTFQGLSRILAIFSKPIQSQFSAGDGFYGIKSVSNTSLYCLQCSTYCTFFHITEITHYFETHAFSRTSYTKFQNFQASNPFAMIFQGPEKWEKMSRTFKTSKRPQKRPRNSVKFWQFDNTSGNS